jgi:hypothetical protein
MPRSDSAPNIAAAQALVTVPADFLWFVARNRETGLPVTDGMWSGVGNYLAPVVDPDTGATVFRTYFGVYGLVSISDIVLVSDVSVQPITITLSQVEARVNQLVRQYDVKQARVEIHRGRFDPKTRLLVAPAAKRFVGFVNEPEIVKGREGEEGRVVLTCVNHTQELLRSNTDTRSHESQQRRAPGDAFFADAAVVADWQQFWGKADGKISGKKKALPF